MRDTVRFRLCQTNPRLGAVQSNLDDHLARAESARADGVDLLVLPELSLTGYFLKDQVPEVALRRDAPELARLAGATRGLALVAGFVEASDDGRHFNAVGWFEDGRLVHLHRKVQLVHYGMFDEGRDFAAGERYEPVASDRLRAGLLTCEDAWHQDGSLLYFLDGVDAVVVPSASPARGVLASDHGLASVDAWDKLLAATATATTSYVLYANRSGWEDGIGFSGHSAVYGPDGERIARLATIDTGCLDGELHRAPIERQRVMTPLRRDAKPWLLARELRRRELEA
ncbi:MAG: nitrilase-related carbon-nitrogen hydrolase [Planctomycetota bacterium]